MSSFFINYMKDKGPFRATSLGICSPELNPEWSFTNVFYYNNTPFVVKWILFIIEGKGLVQE